MLFSHLNVSCIEMLLAVMFIFEILGAVSSKFLLIPMQWRNEGGGKGGQLPPGTAGKGAQNSLVDAPTKVRLMQSVE